MWTCKCGSLRIDPEDHCPECGVLKENCTSASYRFNFARVVELPQGGITIVNPERVMALASCLFVDFPRVGE